MTASAVILFAVLSIWEYPARQAAHEKLRGEFLGAMRSGDTKVMEESCRKGTELLPDDPTWAYNLACALAYRKDPAAALDQLEKAIDLGFRDADAIAGDSDLARISGERRFLELVEYAKMMKDRPILLGPMATVAATGIFGRTLAIGEQNVQWDFDSGLFIARVELAAESAGGNTGDLYMNRDGDHSRIVVTNFTGLTEVRLDSGGRKAGMDVCYPNMLFPYPVFGNCSQAIVEPTYWRSLPRALMTIDSGLLPRMAKLYLSNQVWVYPANADYPPIGENGDCFLSVAPYWIVTQGRSWSDQYYLTAALKASAAMHPSVKRAVLARGLLAPTVQMLLRRSLIGVENDEDYLGPKAHPTCMPPKGLDTGRLLALAKGLSVAEIPPVASVRVITRAVQTPHSWPECIYSSACSSAFILRAAEDKREFTLEASGGDAYEFRVVHGNAAAVTIARPSPNVAGLTLSCEGITNRLDIAVFAKSAKSGWGAPSFVSFSLPPDPDADGYFDPALVPQLKVE